MPSVGDGRPALTPEQRRIVEFGDGPAVVIAGAGTGKTRVIVERVRWLLETKGGPGATLDPPGTPGADDPLLPEQILVLTYNVKAARELGERLEAALGPATKARLAVSNFHSFCHRVLADHAAEAGLRPDPDVLDGVGQVLLLRDIRPSLDLLYHSGKGNPNWWMPSFVGFINRAKDELVTPDDMDAFVERERRAFEASHGPIDDALARVAALGSIDHLKPMMWTYGNERRAPEPDPGALGRMADREARRAVAGTGRAEARWTLTPEQRDAVDALAATYVVDGAALDVLRWAELAQVYRAYQAELVRRGALDFGEQIAAVIGLFRRRPNILRRYQRQFRYLLMDEFQDANVAQIELLEMLARCPDRPAKIMVVGDDDQSIYRFRGASYAAFAEFERRFSAPPAHDPDAKPPGPPPVLRLEENFRSTSRVLDVANRLIGINTTRYVPDKNLHTRTKPAGASVELVLCRDAVDEAQAIVDRIVALAGARREGPDTHETLSGDDVGAITDGAGWSDCAVLYRKHRHRDAIVARLREEDIPYTVVGGLGLFATPEVRDLEQSLRAIADLHDDPALVRMMTAGPWRLDALEIAHVTRRAAYAHGHVIDAIDAMVPSSSAGAEDAEAGAEAEEGSEAGADAEADADPGPVTLAKLRRLRATLDELNAMTWREGPHTILNELLQRTGQIQDLIGADTLEAKRTVANLASFLRFAADWQAEQAHGTLGGFIAYLDAYRDAGGELPTSVEVADDLTGVRLMTLYQAKGLEFPYVFVPQLLENEWPAREWGGDLFPAELLREAIPTGDIHVEEERRLLYVALTRAQEQLVLTTLDGPAAAAAPSLFVTQLRDGAGVELTVVDRTGDVTGEGTGGPDGQGLAPTHEPRVLPAPTLRDRRFALRLRAGELLRLIEGIDAHDPDADVARNGLVDELATLGREAAGQADAARMAGLDPLTLRVLSLDSGAGANLLQVAPLPAHFSYSQFNTYEACPLQYAFSHVYRIPSARPAAALTFGSTAHAAFEAFTKERREREARGEPPPDRADLERLFRAEWKLGRMGDAVAEAGFERRVGAMLDAFWEGELAQRADVLHEELPFELILDPGDGSSAVAVVGSIDRIDRLPSGGIEVLDYKTGRVSSQASVDDNLQLSVYALACRDALGLGRPERVTLYFTEAKMRLSTTRTDEQLDAARATILERAARMRTGDFAATPSERACGWCDYAALCPSRWGSA